MEKIRHAGFWIRLAAYIVDEICLGLAAVALMLLGYGVTMLMPLPFWFESLLRLLTMVLAVLYFPFFESSELRATPGKLLLGLEVVDAETGGDLSFTRAAKRFLWAALTGGLLLFGFIMCAFHGKKQALHDRLTQTVVLKKG